MMRKRYCGKITIKEVRIDFSILVLKNDNLATGFASYTVYQTVQ